MQCSRFAANGFAVDVDLAAGLMANLRKVMRSSRVLAILAVLLVCSPVWTQSPPADLRGIYVYTNDVSQITKATASALTASFGVPGVDGVAVVIGWDAIEPAMGQYQ